MSKITWLLTTAVAALTVGAGGYYYATRTEVTRIEQDVAPPPVASEGKPTTPPAAKPDHGSFQRRFEPKPPAPNGGKLN